MDVTYDITNLIINKYCGLILYCVNYQILGSWVFIQIISSQATKILNKKENSVTNDKQQNIVSKKVEQSLE